MTLHDIRRQIADGELAPAAEAALDYAEKSGVAEAVNSLTAARAALEQTRQLWNSGQLSFEEYARQHARSTQALLDCLDRLPERPTPGAARRMLREEVFKGRLLWMLALGKVLVLGRLGYHWSTGGFNDEQGWACMGILAPTFAAYLYVVLDDYLRAHREPSAPQRYVSGALVRFAYVIIPVYILALLFLMEKSDAAAPAVRTDDRRFCAGGERAGRVCEPGGVDVFNPGPSNGVTRSHAVTP
ncbi:MAG: hypothetical protein IPM81_18010 [Saprospirales bacterium]|nr:hypothetical protein [Saprospirales bacterium]